MDIILAISRLLRTREFPREMLYPSVVLGHFVTLIQSLKASTVTFETFLYGANNFLLTGEMENSAMLLLMESLCIFTVFSARMFAINNWLTSTVACIQLMLWKCMHRKYGILHPRYFVNKCWILLVVKYVWGAPDHFITLYWIAIIMYNYAFYYERKSYHDSMLFIFIAAILLYVALSLDTFETCKPCIMFPGVFLSIWIAEKHHYYQSLMPSQPASPERQE